MTRRRLVQWNREDIIVFALVMAVAAYRFSHTVADPDLWGHVKFGEYFWQQGIVRDDPYSYLTAGTPWTDHEWASEVLFYLAFAAAGPLGLVIGKLAIIVFMLGINYFHLRCREASAQQAGVVVLLVVVMLIPGVTTVRTQIFTYLLFFLLLLILDAASRGSRWIWVSPLLFAVWANLHPGFMAGLAVLAAWAAVHVTLPLVRRIFPTAPESRPITAGAIAAGSFLATALTPFGTELWAFLGNPDTFNRPDISEWQALSITAPYGIAYFGILAISVLGLVLSRRHRDPALVVAFASIGIAPLTALRHGPLFGLAVGVLAGQHIADAWSRFRPTRYAGTDRKPGAWISALAGIAAILCLAGAVRQVSCIRIEPETGARYPVRIVALLKDSGVTGNLAIHFDWGLYAIWHLHPGVKVSLDGRRETAYPPAVYAENARFRQGVGDWDSLLRRRETDMALVSKDFAFFNLMTLTTDWMLVHEDPLSGLFVRKDSLLLERLDRTPRRPLPYDGAGLCFP